MQNADIVLDGVQVAEADRLQHINGFRDLAKVLRITREAVYRCEGTKDMNQLIVGRAITGHAAFV